MGFLDRMKDKAQEMRERAKDIVSQSPNGTANGAGSRAGVEASPRRLIDRFQDLTMLSSPVKNANIDDESSTTREFLRVYAQRREARMEEEVSMVAQNNQTEATEVARTDPLVDAMARGFFDEPSTSGDVVFDPVEDSLLRLGNDFTVEDLSKEEERLSDLADRVSSALNKEILAHGSDFEAGMTKIAAINGCLEESRIVMSNSRRLLQRIGADVKSAMRVTSSHTTKGSILSALRLLEDIKYCQTCENRIRSHLDISEYAEAMSVYSKAWERLENMHALTCTSTLREDFVALRWELVSCVDNVLVDLCGTFDSERFTKLYNTYPSLGNEVKHLADKIQDAFLKAVETQTEGMLRLHAMLSYNQDEAKATRKSRMGYKELCSQLSPMQFVPCLRKTLESLYEIFLSSYKMTAWCKTRMADVVKASDTEAINVCSALIAALEINRKPVVEMASVRLAALLQASSAPSNAAFREVFDLCRVFITCAEAFVGEEVPQLRAQLERVGDRYFESLHSARLDALKAMLENERWMPVSVDAIKRVRDDLRNAMQRGRAAIGLTKTLGDTVMTAFISEQILNAESFLKFIDAPNPFIAVDDKSADVEHKNMSEEKHDGGSDGDEKGDVERNEEETEQEEAAHRFSKTNVDKVGLDRPGVKITASSLYVLQGIVEYTALMQVMRPSVPIIFNGICQLFELALVKTFNAFGRTEALAPESHDMTPRLKGTLSRLGNSGGVMAIRPVSIANVDYMSSGNLYGLKERVVALESLCRVADEFKRIKARVKRSLPLKDAALADRFYSHTVAAVEDLREHVYKSVASLLLNISFCIDAIGDGDPNFALVNSTLSGKYNIREATTRPNRWVADVQGELLRFTTRLACADIAPEALRVLWHYATGVIEDTLVEGFSKVKKCTEPGRALMTLDVQTLQKEFKKLAPESANSDWRYIDTYVQAFYIKEDDAMKWMQIHPEYTKAQKVALVNHASAAFRWTSSTRTQLIQAIETDTLI